MGPILLFLLGYFTSGQAINCYQCNSTDQENPYQCREYMPDDHDLQPLSCSAVYGAQYCIKHTGRFEGGVGTRRYCSSVDMGNYCNYIRQPGDQREYRSCVFTCSSDGCNESNVLRSSHYLVVLILCLTFLYTFIP